MEKESSGSLLEPGPILVSSLDLGAHDLVDEDYKLTELRPLQEPFFEKLLDECEIKDDTGEEEDEDKPVCDGCSLEFTSKLALGQHLKDSKECGSSCRSCGWTFTSKLLLHKHRLEFHAKGDKVKEELSDFVDLGCVKLESDGFEMAEEETTAVVAQEYFEPVERATTENIQIITAFMCDQCSLVFSTEALLLDHKKLHTHPFVICPGEFASKIYFVKDLQFLTDDNYECDKCDATFKEKHLLDAHRPLHDLVYACEHCDAKFKEESALVKHRTRHRVVFRCDVCDAAFKEEGLLVKHKIIHTDPKPFKCSQCGAAFRLKYYLTRHQAIHTGMKPFQCGYCGKHFRQKAHLKKHERIHTGEKPYKCDQCEAAYSDSYHLKLHKVVHSGETPFKCFHCEQGFREKPALRKHMKNHIKAQVCEACGEGFADYAQLKEHKRSAHIGERPFKCDQCPVSFVQESSLIVHKRRHAGEKPYQCSRCKKGFSKKYRLVNHEKTTLCLPKRVHILDPV